MKLNQKEIRQEAKQLRMHPRVWRRILLDTTGTLVMRRFYKFNEWLVRKENSELVYGDGRVLFHKGRKP